MKQPSESDLIDQLRADWSAVRSGLDTSGIAIEGRIMRLGRLLEQKSMDALKPFGLHYTDFDVLATLRRIGPPYCMTPTRLLDSVILTSGAMTAVLKRLELAGLIKREASEEDGRVRTAALTRAGVALTDKAAKARFESARETSSHLTKSEQKDLATLLRKLLRTLESA